MKAIELITEVDERRQLHIQLPEGVPPLADTSVRVIVLMPEVEDDADALWMQGVAREWAAELADEREDIYTLEDGEPVGAAR